MRRILAVFSATLLGVGCAAVLAAGPAAAEILGPEELRAEMRANAALREHVMQSGYPDLAQRWTVEAKWPWQTSLIRLLYLGPQTEVAFSRAYLLGRPTVGLLRYRRPMSDEMATQVRSFLATDGRQAHDLSETAREPGSGLGPAERAEAAAQRAEAAAEATELGAVAAEHAVERLELAAKEAEASFRKQLKK